MKLLAIIGAVTMFFGIFYSDNDRVSTGMIFVAISYAGNLILEEIKAHNKGE